MAKGKYKHNNFSAGQYDREFTGQDNSIHQNGFFYCCNVLSSALGECKARPGTEWKADLDSSSVIIPFRRGSSDLALVFSDKKLNIKEIDAVGNLIDFSPATTETIKWENTANDTPSDTPVSVSGEVSGNTENFYKSFTQNSSQLIQNYTQNVLYVDQEKYPTVYFNLGFTAGKTLSKVVMELLPASGSFNQPDFSNVKNWVKDAVLQYSDDNGLWFTERLAKPWFFSGVGQDTPYGTRVIQGLNLLPLNPQSHKYWRVAVVFKGNDMPNNRPFMVNFNGNVLSETRTTPETITTKYTDELLPKLKYSQQYNELIITDGTNKPYVFSMSGNAPTFEERDYNFIETDGVPSCVRFFQNRLWFGGFASFPNRVRGSQFGNYSNFVVNTDNVVATDPISADSNQITERITDLWGGFSVLYAQSSDGISFIESAGDAVAPTRMNFQLKSYEKASGITPTMKENIMFYVGADKRKIHAFAYDNALQQFVAPDISEYWKEVLKERIKEIHYVDSRNKNLIGVLEDGTMFSLLYDKSGIIGYFPINIGAEVFDASVLKNEDNYDIYLTVLRNGQWQIEKYHQPEFMERTDAFLQTNQERNIATTENLLKSPYIDGWKSLTNEVEQLWKYDAENSTIEPMPSTTEPEDLTGYVGQSIRLYYGSGVLDYVQAFIKQAFTEEKTIDKEVIVSETVNYYGWSYTHSINVSPISGYNPPISGNFTRYPQGDLTGSQRAKIAWIQGSQVCYTIRKFPNIGDGLYAGNESRQIEKSTINSVSSGTILTKTLAPNTGTEVYDTNYQEIGTVRAYSSGKLIYSGNTYTRNTQADATRRETKIETVQVVVQSGSYEVRIERGNYLETNIFSKIQLPITEIQTDLPKIQIQDNGIYQGEFESVDGVVNLLNPMYNIQYGSPYIKIGVIKELTNKGYLKQWGTVAVSMIDTMDIKVGSSMTTLEQLIEFNPTIDFYNSNPIMFNGTMLKNIADGTDYEKTLILYSDKGLPFCVNGLESEMIISDIGGN